MRPLVLTVAGSDSSGAAGVAADLRAFAAAGVEAAVAPTAATVQDGRGLRRTDAVPPAAVAASMRAAGRAASWKTGMLVDAATVRAVAAAARALGLRRLVCDPVLCASTGGRLLDAPGLRALVERLLPLAWVVTPNAPEAEALSGGRVRTVEEAVEAARRILALGPRAVLVKGGHLAGGGEVRDVLATPAGVRILRARRGPPLRGSGCALSAALAARLALGDGLEESVRRARAYVLRLRLTQG